jgi:hypothetical protein
LFKTEREVGAQGAGQGKKLCSQTLGLCHSSGGWLLTVGTRFESRGEFVQDVALKHISSPSFIGFPLLITILLFCHTQLSPAAEVCNSPVLVGLRVSYGTRLITDQGN